MKLQRKPMAGKLTRALCLVGASAIVLGSASMFLTNYKPSNCVGNRTSCVNEISPDTEYVDIDNQKNKTEEFVDDDRYEVKKEIKLPEYDESCIDNSGLLPIEVVKDEETITSDYKDSYPFRTDDILVVTLVDSFDNKSYFLMKKLYGMDVTVGNGMVENYMYLHPEYGNYKVWKWHNEYESIFNDKFFLMEHGYTLKGTNKGGTIYEKSSSSDLAFTSDNDHVLFVSKRIVLEEDGNTILVNTDKPDYAWFRFGENKYDVRLYTIKLSELTDSKLIKYSELKELYSKLSSMEIDYSKYLEFNR